MKNIVILGATESIGSQTLDVIRSMPDRLRAIGLSAHSQWQNVFEQAKTFAAKWVTITDNSLRGTADAGKLGGHSQLQWGEAGIEKMVTSDETHTVVAAMVGSAGLRGAIQALEAGKDLALANKETLVVGGPIVTRLAEARKCNLLPVDSEHSAIFQCFRSGSEKEVEQIILTASGGPFRTKPLDQFANITVEQALDHPTWRMGKKISIDSATMMNKSLEIIEAHWLFGLPAEKIRVTIHPQSIVHSMVEFVDGSVIAQVSPPDMRLPIQYALTYPERVAGPARKMAWTQTAQWDFAPPDFDRFPALKLGYEVIKTGGTSGAALNAANEAAVELFLTGRIRFVDIVPLCSDLLRNHPYDASPTLDSLLNVDRWARQEAELWK